MEILSVSGSVLIVFGLLSQLSLISNHVTSQSTNHQTFNLISRGVGQIIYDQLLIAQRNFAVGTPCKQSLLKLRNQFEAGDSLPFKCELLTIPG